MCMTMDGKALPRICVIDFDTGNLIYNEPVKPPIPITDCSSARPCNNDTRQRADASAHTDKAFGDPAGPFDQSRSACPATCAPTPHQHCAALPPPTRSTSQTVTGMGYAQMTWPHCRELRAWQTESRRRRACVHRYTESQD
ncbi:hypothetical protein BJY52DRAFT_156888 [Lactarius psammicola]|nr:hypothetical protein BJY52DRAFT_156888 [Lactarius psammicola]